MVTKLLDHWNLTAVEQSALLGLSTTSRSTLSHAIVKASRWPIAATCLTARDTCSAFTSRCAFCFYDRDLAYGWMTQFNRRLGARPVDLISERGFEGLLAVRRYLDFQRGY